jgi:hypothetical protein
VPCRHGPRRDGRARSIRRLGPPPQRGVGTAEPIEGVGGVRHVADVSGLLRGIGLDCDAGGGYPAQACDVFRAVLETVEHRLDRFAGAVEIAVAAQPLGGLKVVAAGHGQAQAAQLDGEQRAMLEGSRQLGQRPRRLLPVAEIESDLGDHEAEPLVVLGLAASCSAPRRATWSASWLRPAACSASARLQAAASISSGS